MLNVMMGTAGKAALIKRSYSEMGLPGSDQESIILTEEAARVLTYVTPEIEQELKDLPKFQAVPEKDWGKQFSEVLSKMSFMDIYVYLVERRSKTMTVRQQGNFKSLKG